MKKFTSLLLLLLTMFLWGGVNVVAQTFTPSEAPTNGAWAKNTHWYTIKNKKGDTWYYLSTASTHTDAQGNLMIKGTTCASAEALWCVVKNNGGFKFYNCAVGPNKVLGMTGNEDGGRAKMYDEATVGSNVWTTFYYNTTATKPDNIEANAFRIASSGNKYWNERNSYLAFWDSGNSVKANCEGSAYVFEEVTGSDLDEKLTTTYNDFSSKISDYKSTFPNHVGEMFCFSQESLNALNSLPTEKPTETSELLKTLVILKNGISAFEASRIMPTVGKRYALKNYNYNTYLYTPLTVLDKSQGLHGESLVFQRDCWILESGSVSGTYRLKNAATGLYVYGGNIRDKSQEYKVSLTPTDFTLYLNDGERYGTAKIGTGQRYYNLHIDGGNNLVSWESAPASSWYFEEVSDDDFENLVKEDATALEKAQIALALPVLAANVPTAFAAYYADKTSENLTVLENALEASTYVRIKNVATNLGLGAQSDAAAPHGNTWSTKDAGLIWKLEIVDDVKLKLHHLNTGKYLGRVTPQNHQAVGSSLENTLDAGSSWSFTANGSNFILKDSQGATMNCEPSNGNINRWDADNNQTKWTVSVATDIQVDLKAVGEHTYATTFLPFPVSAVSEGVKAYTGSYDADQKLVTLKETAAIPGNTGVVLMGETASATTATLTIGGNATMTEGVKNAFEGTTTAIALDDNNRSNYLVLGRKSGDQSEIGFFKPLASEIPANRAYITNVNGSGISSVSVNFGTVEEIGSVVTETAEDANSPIFDLSGRRVMHTVKGGLYIRNGKKFLVK